MYLEMEHFSRKRWPSGSALSVSYTVDKDTVLFVLAVLASVLKLIYHRTDPVVVYQQIRL